MKQNGLDSEPQPEIYQPFAQRPGSARAVLIRTAGEPESIMPAVRGVVSRLDPNLPIQRLSALERTLDASLSRRRFNTVLLTIFAGLAVVLAAAGIYGLLSYWVSVRQREIAIRLALGAAPSRILRWTGLQALRLAAVGMTIGVAGAWAAAAGLESVVSVFRHEVPSRCWRLPSRSAQSPPSRRRSRPGARLASTRPRSCTGRESAISCELARPTRVLTDHHV